MRRRAVAHGPVTQPAGTMRAMPGWSGRLLAADVGRDARMLAVLSASSKPMVGRAQRAVAGAVGTLGTRALRKVPVPPVLGLDGAGVAALVADVVPGFEIVGLSVPRQPQRRRVIALGRSPRGVVIAKIDVDPGPVEHEGRILEALGGRTLPGVTTPPFVAAGRRSTPVGEVAVVVQGAVTTRPHAPVYDLVLEPVVAAVADALTPVLGPSPREGWVAQHGDLAPWNLRRTDRGVVLVDWETAGYAPPGTDAAYFAACVHVLTRRPMPPIGAEARQHLQALVGAWTDDPHLRTGLLEALDAAPAA